jgi:serine/threonine protein kinase
MHTLASPVGRIRDIMSELIDYVRALDGLNMVHRDLKPLNIMLSEQGLKVSSRH